MPQLEWQLPLLLTMPQLEWQVPLLLTTPQLEQPLQLEQPQRLERQEPRQLVLRLSCGFFWLQVS